MVQFFHRADMEIKSKERKEEEEMKSQKEREKNEGVESQLLMLSPLTPSLSLSPSFRISVSLSLSFTHTHSERGAKTVIHNWDKTQGYREGYTERHRHKDTEKSYNLNFFPSKAESDECSFKKRRVAFL